MDDTCEWASSGVPGNATFSKGIDPMTDDEQQIAQAIAQAIARAFETLSERLSKELEDALNQMAQRNGAGAETAIRDHGHFW